MNSCLFLGIYSFSNLNCPLVHEEFGPAFAWMGNRRALKDKLQEPGYDGDRDMVVGAVIAPKVNIHLTVAEMQVDYDSALMVMQSLKAR